jgi:putative endonuclease
MNHQEKIKAPHLIDGQKAENMAASFICAQGYQILHKNFKSKWGEWDLIALNPSKNILCFVEVRFRQAHSLVNPLESVHLRKQKKLIKTAEYFLQKHPQPENREIRLDVIGLTNLQSLDDIEWIQAAFNA